MRSLWPYEVAETMQLVTKPETDGRQYLPFTLPNGLRVVVASDPDASTTAAAALAVQVGSVHEPKEVPGLAHFCEHMVVHGTMAPLYDFYSGDIQFAEFVKQHGGSHNGVTTMQQTCFAFEIPPDHLQGALKRFAKFFVPPSFAEFFSRSLHGQEIKAIDSEHSMNLQNDFRRQWAVLLLDANPAHPYHWGSGCAKSLETDVAVRKIDLHQMLETFHRKNYTAERMSLAVVGTQSAKQLEDLVRKHFKDAPRSQPGTPQLPIGDDVGGKEPAFRQEDFTGQVFVVPVKDMRQFRLSWLLPWQVRRWRTKPTAYAMYLLNHEGRGSLLSSLKACGLATGLQASCLDYHGVASTFEINVELTESAAKETASLARVGELVFSYIALLRSSGPQDWVFDEQRQLQALDFRFQYDTTTYNLAQDLACNLHYYPAEAVLAGDHLHYERDPGAAMAVLSELALSRARLWLVARDFEARCTSKEPWYGARFLKLRKVEEAFREPWAAVEAGQWTAMATKHGLKLPKPNCFVPRHLGLKLRSLQPHLQRPQELRLKQSWCRAWFRSGGCQQQPKAAASIFFHCPFTARGSREAALTHMFCQCVQEELSEECAYEARMAGVMYKLEQADTGVLLQFLGFNDRLGVLAAAVSKKMAELLCVKERTWGIVKDQQERLLFNAAERGQAYSQAMAYLEDLFLPHRRPAREVHAAVAPLQREDLEDVSRQLFSECLVEALLIGNLAEVDARALLQQVLDPLDINDGGPGPLRVPARSECEVPTSPKLTVLSVDGANPEDTNGCTVQNLCAVAELTPENEALTSLLMQVVKPRFFNELRTRQQMGYVVSSFMRARVTHLSLVFLVQTERAPDVARRSIDTCLAQTWRHVLQEMSERDFEQQRDGLIQQLEEAPKNLWEALQRDWLPIEERTLAFDARQRQVAFLRRSNLGTLQRFVQQSVQQAPRLAVLLHSAKGPGASPLRPGSGGQAFDERDARRLDSKSMWAFREGLKCREMITAFGSTVPREPESARQPKVRAKPQEELAMDTADMHGAEEDEAPVEVGPDPPAGAKEGNIPSGAAAGEGEDEECRVQ